MSRPIVPSRSPVWPRVAVLAMVGIGAAGCSDSARFDSNPFASNRNAPPPSQDVTGSVGSRPATSGRVETQPLPSVSRPATVPAGGGVASGAQGLGAYRPSGDITGSVAAAQPSGHWTWDGGSPVTVGQGETVETIARRHGVPASAIMQTNNISSPTAVRPGQRLVIPRYVTAGTAPARTAPVQTPHVQAPQVQAPQTAPARSAAAAGSVHVVQPGETLIGIARRNGLTLSEIARANNIQPYTKVNIGDRVTVPGTARPQPVAAARPAPVQPAPQPVAQYQQPRPAPQVDKVASIPAQTARLATQETPAVENPVKEAEAAGSMPSFRWPVKGRIISAFGAKVNGVTNDGINLAVPEGTPVKAAEDGVVAYAGNELKGYGNLVLVRHANGYVSAYANASELLVKRGDSVKRGQDIARAGQTGNVTSPQLHFEIRKGSTPVDPTKYLSGV
ncbi:MAG: peptidoglycan DD-metalloendopeptidase family protein [Pseudolabrys sp.]